MQRIYLQRNPLIGFLTGLTHVQLSISNRTPGRLKILLTWIIFMCNRTIKTMLKKKLILSLLLFLALSSHQNIFASQPETGDYLKIGGALRYNTVVENYENGISTESIYSTMDTWFLSVDGNYSGLDVSFQYRFYPGSKTHFIHHGYFGYGWNDNWYAKAGVFQKPFGIGAFASHSWWFQVPYYMGLEDTYNTGLGLEYQKDNWKFDLAYFRQAAPKGPIGDNTADNAVGNGRFSYAVVPTTGIANGQTLDASIRELDQFNLRARYQASEAIELGVSAQLGNLYNSNTKQNNWGFSWAAHSVIQSGNWNFKGEVIGYDYKATADNGSKLDVIQMAAYGAAYDVAAQGNIYVAGLAYTFPIDHPLLRSIQPYIDYSVVDKRNANFADTHHLIPGVLFTVGPTYIYLDYALGKNQPWLTSQFGKGLGAGDSNATWNSRLNLNIGYYF